MISTIRNIIASSSGRRKMILDRKLYLQKDSREPKYATCMSIFKCSKVVKCSIHFAICSNLVPILISPYFWLHLLIAKFKNVVRVYLPIIENWMLFGKMQNKVISGRGNRICKAHGLEIDKENNYMTMSKLEESMLNFWQILKHLMHFIRAKTGISLYIWGESDKEFISWSLRNKMCFRNIGHSCIKDYHFDKKFIGTWNKLLSLFFKKMFPLCDLVFLTLPPNALQREDNIYADLIVPILVSFFWLIMKSTEINLEPKKM